MMHLKQWYQTNVPQIISVTPKTENFKQPNFDYDMNGASLITFKEFENNKIEVMLTIVYSPADNDFMVSETIYNKVTGKTDAKSDIFTTSGNIKHHPNPEIELFWEQVGKGHHIPKRYHSYVQSAIQFYRECFLQ